MKASPYTINKARYEEERNRHGEKDCDVAEYLHLTRQRFSNLKNGDPIDERYLRQLGDKWGINWKWLCGLSDERDEWSLFWHDEWATSWAEMDRYALSDIKIFLRCLGYLCDFKDAPNKINIVFSWEGEQISVNLDHNQFTCFMHNLVSIARPSARALLGCMTFKDNDELLFSMPIFTESRIKETGAWGNGSSTTL